MLSKSLEAAMNEQIKAELYSAYLYLSMSAWCESNNLGGSAHWMALQAKEEQEHALKFFKYIHERGGKVTLQGIPQPPTEFASVPAIFEQVAEHEGHVTSLINKLMDLAVKESDYASQAMLTWFVTEQVEEEKHADEIVQALRMLGSQGTALFMVDRWLGDRK